MSKSIVLLYLCFLFSSCQSLTTVTKISEDELRLFARKIEWHTASQIYYMGRKDGYDHFWIEWGKQSKVFRVPKVNQIINHIQLYSEEKKHWHPCGPRSQSAWLP